MGKLFGTDGVRGVANKELTCELAFKLGQVGAYVLASAAKHTPKILVGKDTRASGGMLECALIAGLCSMGAQSVQIGVAPTPAIAFLVRALNADAGVVISASHNPMEYNGIKFFNSKGYKLSDSIEDSIEDILLNNRPLELPSGIDVGNVSSADALIQYENYAASTIDNDLSGMKIVVDCANGSAYKTAPETLRRLGAEVIAIHDQPNGFNINDECGSTHLGDISRLVPEMGAHLGLAFDGDADRVLAVDEKGSPVSGDHIMLICALGLKQENRLAKNTLVTTVMSNIGLFLAGREQDVNIVQTKVGDRYVLEKMLKDGYIIGGEQSGHVIFLEHNTTGDGLITALQLISYLKKSHVPLSQLAGVVSIYPQVLVNVKVADMYKATYMENFEVAAEIKRLEAKYEGVGRVLIRPSGTEPLVRVMIEGKEQAVIEKDANALADLMRKTLV